MKRDMGSLKVKLEDLDECVDRKTVVEKGKDFSYSSESSEESDSVETVRERKAVSHKQQRRARLRRRFVG